MSNSVETAAIPALTWPPLPRQLVPLDNADTKKWVTELHDRLQQDEQGKLIEALNDRSDIEQFLAAAFTLSPYLRDCALIRPANLAAIFSVPPQEALEALLANIGKLEEVCENEAELMEGLRRGKVRLSLLCGLADLGGWWEVEQITAALTAFADAALAATISFLLRELHRTGKVELADAAKPQPGSGLIVLGMGKYGAGELNYSSDIDLILFFERAEMQWNTDDPVTLFVRLAKSLIRILQERTGDGYVFRVDLRLRPDPGSMPLVIPVETALNYYEASGQNWERAAMIKARPVAGDIEAGHAVLRDLAPFIWRKYLDYAAISDVQSMKRQIHAHKGHGSIAVEGHNIKLGRGGIREIEFFAQTQQLIAGGRLPQLRMIGTVDALIGLEREGWIDAEARDYLTEAYRYLRNVEHRIQMVADEQSHTLPEDEEGLKRIALMMGDRDVAVFSRRLTEVLRCVERHYAGLFEAAPTLSSATGNLVFTGEGDDPHTIDKLGELGFEQPAEVIRIVRAWHYGRIAALRSSQARELLGELTPDLLAAIASTGEADQTLYRFDRFVSGLPAGIQLFSLLKSNPGLLRLLLRILSSAPRLAEIITRKPHVFDGLLEPGFSGLLPEPEILRERLHSALQRAPDYESTLDAARVFAAEQKFLIGARLINGTLGAARAGRAFSDLADIMISETLNCVMHEFETRHGKVAGGRICVLGMGRLGGRELTAGSDLDLILLYDHDEAADYSDGKKQLAASQYFIRLAQRLIAAMSAPTAEGVIYELDFRLRPSGNAGPLATHVDSFLGYQRKEAWTWEKMALTRARPCAGNPEMMEELETQISQLLVHSKDTAERAADIREMRVLIDKEKPAANCFDVKTAKGGLIDIEFLGQWAQLEMASHGAESRWLSTQEQIENADVSIIAQGDREKLLRALELYGVVLQFLRLCIEDAFEPKTAPAGLSEILCQVLDLPDIEILKADLKETQKAVRSIFNRALS